MCTKFVEVILQCSAIQGMRYNFTRICKWKSTISVAGTCSLSYSYPGIVCVSLAILPVENYDSLKSLKWMFLRLTKIQIYFCSLSRLGSLTLKPATFEDIYHRSVASEASGGRMLNTNQLRNIEQLLNTNQQLIL